MKAYISIVDDDGKVLCVDQALEPVREEIVERSYGLPIKEARFSFIITQLAEFPTLGAEFHGLEDKNDT